MDVDTTHLRQDAETWRTTAAALAAASTAAGNLTISSAVLSFMADETELTAAYEDVRATVVRWTKEGHAKITTLASVLTFVAGAYDSSNDEAKLRLDGVWEPMEF